jgi:hypothetical protein
VGAGAQALLKHIKHIVKHIDNLKGYVVKVVNVIIVIKNCFDYGYGPVGGVITFVAWYVAVVWQWYWFVRWNTTGCDFYICFHLVFMS